MDPAPDKMMILEVYLSQMNATNTQKLHVMRHQRYKNRRLRRRGPRALRRRGINASSRVAVTPGHRFTGSTSLAVMGAGLQRAPCPRSPFPMRYYTTLRYCDVFTLASMASTPSGQASQVWCLNSLYDPDVTGGGHQPYFYDQFMSSVGPYSKSCVLGTRVVVDASPANDNPAGSAIAFNVACGPTITRSAPPHSVTDVPELLELPGWTGGVVCANQRRSFKFQFDIARLFGRPRVAIESEDNYSAGYNANPASMYYLQVIAQGADNQGGNLTCSTLLEFDVVFYDLYQGEPES